MDKKNTKFGKTQARMQIFESKQECKFLKLNELNAGHTEAKPQTARQRTVKAEQKGRGQTKSQSACILKTEKQ